MIRIDTRLTPKALLGPIDHLFDLSARKIALIEKTWNPYRGHARVHRRGHSTRLAGGPSGRRASSSVRRILQFDATDDAEMLEIGRRATLQYMASHVSHVGVHDHGFNNISTYGNLLRLARDGRIAADAWEIAFYELALKVSGAIQAARWTDLPDGLGYICSFNGPHSLFADTMRSLRSLAVGHALGHALMGERDRRISLLQRLIQHADTNARFNVYFGKGRDSYDVRGRVVHESIFNVTDGSYRCPSSQQGYSPFTTWTRGLAWVLLGYAEELEFLDTRTDAEFKAIGQQEGRGAEAIPRRGPRHRGLLHHRHTDVRRAVLGHRRARARAAGRLPRSPGGSVQRPRAGGQLRGRDRGAGTDPARHVPRVNWRGSRRQAVSLGRTHDGTDAVLGAVPVDEREASGPAAARGLPSTERVGPHPARPDGPVRRVVHVGRLPRPRTGPADPAHGPQRAVLHVLRGRRCEAPLHLRRAPQRRPSATAIGTRTSMRIQRSTRSAPLAVFSKSKVS